MKTTQPSSQQIQVKFRITESEFHCQAGCQHWIQMTIIRLQKSDWSVLRCVGKLKHRTATFVFWSNTDLIWIKVKKMKPEWWNFKTVRNYTYGSQGYFLSFHVLQCSDWSEISLTAIKHYFLQLLCFNLRPIRPLSYPNTTGQNRAKLALSAGKLNPKLEI